MKTEVIQINSDNIELAKLKRAAAAIKQGGVIGLPTETVYGLACDYFNQKAIKRIVQLKKRPQNKPFTIQIADVNHLERFTCDIPIAAYQLISAFWPGPLTLVFKGKDSATIGMRIPSHKVTLALIKESQTALVVPSANRCGEPPAQTAEELLKVFDGQIEMVIDAGRAELGVASTVVDFSAAPYRILREGAISKEDIQNAQR